MLNLSLGLSLGSYATLNKGVGALPSPGYLFLRGKQQNETRIILRGKEENGAYVALQGKG